MKYILRDGYKVIIIDQVEYIDDDNIDVEVRFPDQTRYSATMFTLKNIQKLMTKNQQTGECNYGQYFWCSDIFIIRDLREETILEAIQSFLDEGKFKQAFDLLENDDDYDYWLDEPK